MFPAQARKRWAGKKKGLTEKRGGAARGWIARKDMDYNQVAEALVEDGGSRCLQLRSLAVKGIGWKGEKGRLIRTRF